MGKIWNLLNWVWRVEIKKKKQAKLMYLNLNLLQLFVTKIFFRHVIFTKGSKSCSLWKKFLYGIMNQQKITFSALHIFLFQFCVIHDISFTFISRYVWLSKWKLMFLKKFLSYKIKCFICNWSTRWNYRVFWFQCCSDYKIYEPKTLI